MADPVDAGSHNHHVNGGESGDSAPMQKEDSFERDFKAMLREDGAPPAFASSLQFEQQDQSPFADPNLTPVARPTSAAAGVQGKHIQRLSVVKTFFYGTVFIY